MFSAGNESDWHEYIDFHSSWDDIQFPATQARISPVSSKPDFDETNVGFLMPQDLTTEVLYFIGQFSHHYVPGTDIKPHIHYQQSAEEQPTFKIAYKWYDNGDAVPADWTTIASTGNVFTYTTGNLAQIATFPDIDGSGITGSSSIILVKLYRDDNVVTGDVLLWELDFHYQKKATGSRYEYSEEAT